MRTKHLLGIGVLTLLALSCTNDEVVTSPSDGQLTINATYEIQDGTRATVDNSNGTFSWADGDEIALYSGKGYFFPFKTASVNGSEASFFGVVVGDNLNANGLGVFPSSIVNTTDKVPLTDNKLTVTLPSEYTYVKDVLNAPMLAVSTDGNKTYPFKHLGGVLWLQVNHLPAGAYCLQLKALKQIAGEFTVDLNEETPTINLPEGEDVADKDNVVTVNLTPSATIISEQDIYIPLPVGTYYKFTISFLDYEGEVLVATNGNKFEYDIESSAGYTMNRTDLAKLVIDIVDVTGTLEGATIYADDDETINSALAAQADGSTVNIVATSKVKKIRLNSTAVNTTTTLTLNEGGEDNTILITEEDGTTSQDESTGDVYVNLASSDDDTATDAIIEAGSKSVYLVSGNIGTATSTTAGTTLVIQKGATVKKIILKGGNIKLESGVTIPAFEDGRTDKTQTVYVINETGETLTLPDGWMAVASAEYVDIYKFVSEVNNTSDGGTFKLERDYTFPAGLSIPTRTFTIDLNGHTIKALSGIVNMFTINKSHITITDSSADKSGTIDAYATSQCAIRVLGNYGSAKHGEASLTINGGNIIGKNQAIWAYAAAQVTVMGGTITADNSAIDAVDYNEGDEPTEIYVKGNAELIAKGVSGVSSGTCVCLWPLKNSTAGKIKLEVTSDDVKMTTLYEGFAISGNGTYHGTEITITGGTFKSAGNALYHPQDGILKISGGTFDGQKSGIEVRSGTLEITGGKFISHADPPSSFANGSGTTSNGSALAIAQHTTKKPISVKISGGEFDGAYAFFEHNPQNNDAESIATITLDIKGGTFSGNVYSEDKTGFISGGKYSANPSTYVAEGHSVTQDSDNGYWVVQ